METVIHILDALPEEPTRGVTEYDRRGRPAAMRSYREIHGRVGGIAAALARDGVTPGQVVFLQLPNGLDLVECFLAAIAIGAVPCCLAPPRALGGLEAYRERMGNLMAGFPGCHLIADEDTGSRSGQPYRVVPAAGAAAPGNPAPTASPPPPDQLAFIQLTSGTSKQPKAVRISHGALVANTDGILHSGRATADDNFVTWLPLYHDMGLVGMLMCALRSRCHLHLFRPETFAARPGIWLNAIAGVAGTAVTSVPNFALQHCVDALPEGAEAGLDLSRWRVAACGAERVRPETLDQFAARFGKVGFRPEAFVPCYGMAEATLALTFTSRDTPPKVLDGHVGCGRPLPATELVIRDPGGEPVADGIQGEITARGPGLCSGYTSDLEPASIRDGWLHTGDRGMIVDGELYVTGRFKDLIIIDGHNLDPDELEAVGDDVVHCPGGRCGAFAVEVDGREQPVLVVEVPLKSDDRIAGWDDAIGAGVASRFGLRLHDLVFVSRGDLPTTSSGKVRRAELRELYLAGGLPSLRGGS